MSQAWWGLKAEGGKRKAGERLRRSRLAAESVYGAGGNAKSQQEECPLPSGFLLSALSFPPFSYSSLDADSSAVSMALMYSRFSSAMFESLTPAGQAASHSPVLVQLPKPS